MVTFAYSGTSVLTSPTMTGSANGMTFTLITGSVQSTVASAGMVCGAFVSNQLVPGSPVAMTVTISPGGSVTGMHLVVLGVSGMTNVGTAAVRTGQTATALNAAAATPTVTMPAAALTTNPVIAWASNLTGTTTTLTPPTSFTERYDNGYATPTTGHEVSTRDSGHTSATVTAGSTMSQGTFHAMELDASVPATAASQLIIRRPLLGLITR